MKKEANNEALKLLTCAFPSRAISHPLSRDGPALSNSITRPQLDDRRRAGALTASADISGHNTALIVAPKAGDENDFETDADDAYPPDQAGTSKALVPVPQKPKRTRAAREAEAKKNENSKGGDTSGDDGDEKNENTSDESEGSEVDNSMSLVVRKKARKSKSKAAPKPRKRVKKGHAGKGKFDPSLEAEFALAMLENISMQEIVKELRISNAELPALTAEEARTVLQNSDDPLLAAQARQAEEREAVAAARLEPRADDATLLRVSQFLQVQNGEGLNIVSEPLQRVITEDMKQRAAEMETQNAEPYELSVKSFGKKAKKKSRGQINITLDDIDEAGELALDISAEGNEVVPNRDEQLDATDVFSDIDDTEIEQYIATPEEAEVRKQIWLQANKEYLEEQKVKKAAQREMELLPKKKYKKRKPVIEFKKGATARESVVNMLESKNLMGAVSNEAVDKFFTDAERLCDKEPSELPAPEPPKESAIATAIKGEQASLHNKQSALAQKHEAALLREEASQGPLGWLNLGVNTSSKRTKRPIRLGKL